MPTSSETSVVLPAHLHARPAGQLAQAAGRFSSAVQLDYEGQTINPTGVLAVMALGATAGKTVVVRAEGEDAEEAVSALAEILTRAE
ncbi:HPr family phosphocarrier protein [Streptomyces sp. JJ36]|uniref:HPr family phosphocarrier protein n=1 Tax=Streptomyces sp. JJ36 TaxID=2736645 RepID=UPI001F220EC0|nr:HPr family phosphocarrier protein [Streptomyces sp. JJ36]MCF6524888.1 HPr family phosphocarrier protein [Streptomyces sp. JJ36]